MRLSKLLSFCLLLTWTVRAQNSSSIAAVNGTKLYYEVAGRGEALVFIHSIALDTRVWNAQWSVFSKKFRAIRYDVRGYGQSGRAHDPHD
ncbi:MAG: alpha/beta fold hydrolase, partial [Runella zeae]